MNFTSGKLFLLEYDTIFTTKLYVLVHNKSNNRHFKIKISWIPDSQLISHLKNVEVLDCIYFLQLFQ